MAERVLKWIRSSYELTLLELPQLRGAPCLLRAVYLQQEKILCGSHFRSIVACVLQGFSSIQIVDVSKMFHNFVVFSTLKRLIDYYETEQKNKKFFRAN